MDYRGGKSDNSISFFICRLLGSNWRLLWSSIDDPNADWSLRNQAQVGEKIRNAWSVAILNSQFSGSLCLSISLCMLSSSLLLERAFKASWKVTIPSIPVLLKYRIVEICNRFFKIITTDSACEVEFRAHRAHTAHTALITCAGHAFHLCACVPRLACPRHAHRLVNIHTWTWATLGTLPWAPARIWVCVALCMPCPERAHTRACCFMMRAYLNVRPWLV